MCQLCSEVEYIYYFLMLKHSSIKFYPLVVNPFIVSFIKNNKKLYYFWRETAPRDCKENLGKINYRPMRSGLDVRGWDNFGGS